MAGRGGGAEGRRGGGAGELYRASIGEVRGGGGAGQLITPSIVNQQGGGAGGSWLVRDGACITSFLLGLE